MKKIIATLIILASTATLSVSWAVGESSTQPAPRAGGDVISATSNTPPAGTPESAQIPPANWTRLEGTVQSEDPVSKTIYLKDNVYNLLQVPIDAKTVIERDGKDIPLNQVQTGDLVALVRRS